MTAFEFATARRILFGPGKLDGLAEAIDPQVRRVLWVHGRAPDALPRVRSLLAARGLAVEEFEAQGEPTLERVRAGLEAARGCEWVIGLGGGSALDTGKAVAALAANPGDPLDYLEVIGRGSALKNPSLPFVAIPTTAGTGTEVTRNAVIESPAHRLKVSLRSPWMLPHLALVDPQLTHSLPPQATASTGLDALTQLIEPFLSVKAGPMTDSLCREGIRRVSRSLKRAWSDGSDAAAREDMSLAALFGGLALANAALGVVHGFAGPLGGMLGAPHGTICARLLPQGMAANLDALRSRTPGGPALERFEEIARLLTGDEAAGADDGIRWVEALVSELGIPRLSRLGLDSARIPEAVQKAAASSSYKGNPLPLTEGELAGILERAL